MTFLLAILILFALLASSYGFGFAAMKWGIRDEVNCFSLQAVVGVSCLIFMGGILNLAGLAYPVAIYILLAVGLVFFIGSFSVRFKLRAQPGSAPSDHKHLISLLPICLVAIAVIFFAVTLLPSNVFNIHDDFHTYVQRPMRMLQTGSLGGNPYDLLGLDSLGAQAFMQGFILLKLPIEYLPGFDPVFSMGLAGLLLMAIARKFNLSWIYATFAILVFLVINPQSVNVSTLYSGVFVILGLLLASCLLTERVNDAGIAKPLGMAALTGLLISSLVALKITLVIYTAIYCAFFCMGLFILTRNKRRVLLISGIAGLAATITLLPWLLLHLPNYLAALKPFAHAAPGGSAGGFSLPKGNVSALFSARDLFYGGSLLSYGSIVLVLMALGALSVFFMLRGSHVRQRGYALVSASACIAAIVTYFLDGLLFDPATAVRYVCPVLIATLPFAMLTSTFVVTPSLADQQQRLLSHTPFSLVILAVISVVIALFGYNFADRVTRVYSKRSTVSFPESDRYIEYNRYVLSEETRQAIRNIQYQAEAGTKIFAWISMPMHLDFTRNEIQAVMEPGLINPWINMPLNDNPADMAEYFKSQGVRYIFWEHRGFGIRDSNEYRRRLHSPFPIYRRLAERNLYMRDMLTSMMNGGVFVYNHNGIVLFDLNQLN